MAVTDSTSKYRMPNTLSAGGSGDDLVSVEVTPDLLAEFFEQCVDAVFVGLADGHIIYANAAACQLFRASEEELCRLGRQGITDTDDPATRLALSERARQGWVRTDLPMIRADGSRFMAEITSVLFSTPTGPRVGIVVRDVTDRVRLERNMAALNDVAQVLLGGGDPTAVLALVARHARIIFDATDAAVVTKAEPPDDVVVTAAQGLRMSKLLGRRYPTGSLARRVMDSREALLVEDLSSVAQTDEARNLGLGPAMVAPIVSGETVLGVLFVVARAGSRPYDRDSLALVETFAERAGLALAIGEARAEAERHQRRLAAQLQRALDSRIIVEQAKGVIASVRSITPNEAFEQLRAYARSHNQDIHGVAQAIVQRKLLL
jgi:PAS domain S-box-containing protein